MWQQNYASIFDVIQQTTENTPAGICLYSNAESAWFVFDPHNQTNPTRGSQIAVSDFGRWVQVSSAIENTAASLVPLRLKRLTQVPFLDLHAGDDFVRIKKNDSKTSVLLLFSDWYAYENALFVQNSLQVSAYNKSCFFVTSFVPNQKYTFAFLNRTTIADNLWLAPEQTLKVWVIDKAHLLLFPLFAYSELFTNLSFAMFPSSTFSSVIELIKHNADQFVEVENFNKPFSLTFTSRENLILIETVYRENESASPFRAYLPCDFYPTQVNPTPSNLTDSVLINARDLDIINYGGESSSVFETLNTNYLVPKESAMLLDGVFLVSPTLTDSYIYDGLLKPFSIADPDDGGIYLMDYDFQEAYDYTKRGSHPLNTPFVHKSAS